MFCGECSSPTYLQHLCCQRISYSSSLHEGYDEPEILLNQIVKSVPNAMTLDTCQTELRLRLKRRTSPSINVGVFGFSLGKVITVFNTVILHS
jgi:hypothetical protein